LAIAVVLEWSLGLGATVVVDVVPTMAPPPGIVKGTPVIAGLEV
jgi:hypothetical protein